jgi:tetratricopeptide (TPR) repeat protein
VALARGLETPSRKSDSLAAIAGQYLKAGDGETASQLLSEALDASEAIDDSLFKAGSLNDIAEFAEVGHLERGLLVAKTIKETDNRVWAYTELALRFAALGRRDRAAEVLAQALADAESIPKPNGKEFDNREFELVRVGRTYGRVGLPEQALKIARRVRNPFQRGDVLLAAASALAEQKQSVRAIATAESVHYEVERTDALIEVAAKLTKVGLKRAASQALANALHTMHHYQGGFDSDNGGVRGLVAAALGYADNGQTRLALVVLSEAARVAPTIRKPWSRDEGLARVASVYARMRNFDQALRAVSLMIDARERPAALADVARGVLSAGDKARAFELLSQVVRDAKAYDCSYEKPIVLPDLSDPSRPPRVLKFSQCHDFKASALAAAAEAYLAGGSVGEAVETFNLAADAALPNEDEYDADPTWRRLVDGFVVAGEYERALETATKMNYPSRRLAAIASVELGMSKASVVAGVESQKIFTRLGCVGGAQK